MRRDRSLLKAHFTNNDAYVLQLSTKLFLRYTESENGINIIFLPKNLHVRNAITHFLKSDKTNGISMEIIRMNFCFADY